MLPVPVWVLKLMLGKMSAVILNSNKVSAEKILSTGFKFKYPEITPALSAIIELPKQLN
jgi:NAD dependent epimerase/dehydratase family enzyme